MRKSSTESKSTLIKRIVEIDVALCSEDLTPEQRKALRAKRDRLERRVYRNV